MKPVGALAHTLANAMVSRLLRSPAHRLLSGSVWLISYTGRRSGRRISTPTQYARYDGGVVILVGRSEAKTWWRNFADERDLDLLLQRSWTPTTARAVRGASEPEVITPLVDAYLARFPRAARALGKGPRDMPLRGAVAVWARPR